MAAAMNMRPAWPSIPRRQRTSPPRSSSAGSGACPRVTGETAALPCDTLGSTLSGGIVLSATTSGLALEATFSSRATRPGLESVKCLRMVQ